MSNDPGNGDRNKTGGSAKAGLDPAALSDMLAGFMAGISKDVGVTTFVTALTDYLALLCVSLGAVFCVVTAFGLPLSDMTRTAVFTGLGVVVMCSPCFILDRRKAVYTAEACVLALTLLILSRRIYYAVCTATAVISGIFGRVFGTGVWIPEGSEKGVMCDAAAAALAMIFAFLWTPVCVYGRMTGLDVIILTLTLTPCLIIEDHIPKPWAVVMLAAGLCFTLVPRTQKRSSREEGGRTALILMVPLTLLCLLPLRLNPPDTYTPKVDLKEKASEAVEMLEKVFDPGGGARSLTERISDLAGIDDPFHEETDFSDLKTAGPRRLSSRPVMYIYTKQQGKVYLKGVTMERYEDNAWHSLDLSGDPFYVGDDAGTDSDKVREDALKIAWQPAKLLSSTESSRMYINTVEPINVLYYPYYADRDILGLCDNNAEYIETYIPNTSGTDAYSCEYRGMEHSPGDVMHTFSGADNIRDALRYELEVEDSSIPITIDEGHILVVERNDEFRIDWSLNNDSPYSVFARQHYLYVPGDIKGELEEIARENGLLGLNAGDTPAAVAEYVRKVGKYDLNAPRVRGFCPLVSAEQP